MNIIELEDVWKIYRIGEVEIPALRGLSLKVKPGEFVAVMGPSGSGKSTAMNMIGCLDIPTKGRVLLEGQDIAALSEIELARIRGKKIGFVFQSHNLYPTLTTLENVQLPMRIHEFSEVQIWDRSEELLQLVGLSDRANHYPSQLSGGQSQRVAIARALSTYPLLLLADEPTGNLDTEAGGEVLDIFAQLNAQGVTVVMITHDEKIAERANKIVRMIDGALAS
ncbi:ABC-type antimicrobial peptide transport system, ATPase component [Candidatus Methanoperedens nitroreducens]|uniref:ABC-type antimicrobial peptide transport system, ATPase component n=1 Tax=Candidatus Methanoperedens nitratireducens TaxID=1392998 RepID=A0A062V287_9EURY|nr:ABC transporter ATP-binding protein [Candidatus Methanoperedens nitroreducens]KCZ70753.1 ABC-type antimicrobial peptide transport system, ATPase component [Candidatus Methanoperedens nitroreducens]